MTSLEFSSLIGLKDYRDSLVAILQPRMISRRVSELRAEVVQPSVRRVSDACISILWHINPVSP
jgi:hypothetical protein